MAWWIQFWKQTEDYAFLREAPAQSLQQTAKALERAFKDAFDKTKPNKRLPKPKKLGKNEAGIKYPQGFKLDENNRVIRLPKLGWVKYRNSRPIKGVIKNVTVSRHGCHCWLSIQTERAIEKPVHPASGEIGLDLGVKRLYTLSNGDYHEPFNIEPLAKQLIHTQRTLSRRVKFSANWHKQKKRINRLNTRIAHARLDTLHKATTRISQNHAMIYVEDLKVNHMTRSAKGTLNDPGRQVRQNPDSTRRY
ncbi:MAG: transposase [Methylicorpusculum sp.]|jgi:putative transposase|uniref:RNA-guided endonuclease InsQ/TnpB family protein n=1 Tax=Methylicorpusculum TaxID=2713642 RepID=UPI00135C0EB8|nr:MULTISPECIES: RNA-guided endonuclease TnpB family protein [Methylicorpusculum]MCD2452045.1 transposase [Methylicorpusculum oleiharenae]MDP2203490.1 transposase [Methylicorpusculum sp.]